jgi:L-arabinose isomerase
MNPQCSAGLIPFYLELYDEIFPDLRSEFQPMLDRLTRELGQRGVRLTASSICRKEGEFQHAVAQMEASNVDSIVTVHLAYSPSLEAVEAFVATRLPLVLFDTTMDAVFGFETKLDRMMFNHGIHGVQDFASVLRRRGRDYRIVAGHVEDPVTLNRLAASIRAAKAARLLRTTRALRIGDSFSGMGDFNVSSETLHRVLGIEVTQSGTAPLVEAASQISESEIEAEMAHDRLAYHVEADADVHRRSVRVGLALRRVLEQGGYTAFSMNFIAFDTPDGPVNTVPFLEASKAMARGVGYAGEGDVLTAALVAALAQSFSMVNFTEMFCPSWTEGSIFLSHMGEFNPATAATTPRLIEKDFPWTPARNPAILTASPIPGPAVVVNLAPGPGDTFSIIAAPGEILGDTHVPEMQESIRGWFRPKAPLASFLEQYSRCGGTHHCALVHGQTAEAIEAFAYYAGLPCTTIGGQGG